MNYEYWILKPKDEILYNCIKENQPIARIELQKLLVDSKEHYMSYTTFQKYLVEMREVRKIIYNEQTKVYSINPLFNVLTKDSEEQLRYEYEKRRGKIKTLEFLSVMENELSIRISNEMLIKYNFGTDLKNKIYFSNEVSSLISRLLYSLIRECIIMNPELWHVMNKPEHFNFYFGFECKLGEDERIMELINELKNHVSDDLKEVPLFVGSPFSRHIRIENKDLENIKLTESKKNKLRFNLNIPEGISKEEYLKNIYSKAVGESFLLQKAATEEHKKGIEQIIKENLRDIIISSGKYIQPLLKELGEKQEYNPFYKEYREKIQHLKDLIQKNA